MFFFRFRGAKVSGRCYICVTDLLHRLYILLIINALFMVLVVLYNLLREEHRAKGLAGGDSRSSVRISACG